MEKEILNKMKDLKKKLYKIHCQNWILNKSDGKGASGNTLELLLDKKYDNYALPDIDGIEIKCRNKYSGYSLHLFCLTPDNNPLEIQRLLS